MRLIDADEIKKKRTYLWDEALGHCACVLVEDIDNAPTIEAEPVKHGKWVHDGQRVAGGVDWYHCSVCLHPVSGVYAKRPFCSMCGAKMDGCEPDY